MKPDEAAKIIARLGAEPLKVAHRRPVAKDWEQLERVCCKPVPQGFKAFATMYNGYSFHVALFKLNNPAFARNGGVEQFHGFGGGYSLLRELKGLQGRTPNGFLPFGNDATGNQVCLDTNTKRGAVYYWDHELEHLGPWGCVAKASSSFDAFLRSLTPLESE